MPASSRRSRSRGTVDELPSGAIRVRVYAGSDPLTGKRHDLTEVVPAGPRAAAEAEKVRSRLLNQVDEQRNPRTKATVNQLLDRYLAVLCQDLLGFRVAEPLEAQRASLVVEDTLGHGWPHVGRLQLRVPSYFVGVVPRCVYPRRPHAR